jgi:signal transduction histidine kinase
MFELGDTTDSERGGSGVGLSVSRDIVESLGGRLTLEPRSGGEFATVSVPGVATTQ